MAKVIQISGKKRHGKDSVASLLKANFAGARIISFAGPMKQILATVLNMSLEELDARKNVDNEYRVYLQRLGNEAIKPIFGDDVWYNLMLKELAKLPKDQLVIIPDWRFAVEEIPGAYKLRVNRPSVPVGHDNHASEIGLDSYEKFDYVLTNPEGISELQEAMGALIEDIKKFFGTDELPVEEEIVEVVPSEEEK